MTDWNNLKPPAAPTDGWGAQANDPNAIQTDGGWGVAPVKPEFMGWQNGIPTAVANNTVLSYPLADYSDAETRSMGLELTEAIWTANALDSAQVKASVVNSLAGTKDAFNVDQDGELTRMKEIATGEQPLGYYIAYSNGKWLHAILSGPYDSAFALDAWGDAAYEFMTNDAAFKLAFNNTFDRSGIYLAQIPLSAKRHGAYGVLS